MARTTSGSQRLLKWVGNGLLAVLLVWTLLPFYWMIATSLKADREIYGFEATLYPHRPTLAAYGRLFRTTPFVEVRAQQHDHCRRQYLVVARARLPRRLRAGSAPFPGRALIARGLVVTYLVPPALLFIPLFSVLSILRLIDTHQGLILTYLSFSVPFSTWLLMGYFRSVPLELEEAALVDGCSRLGSLIRVILPMSLPALAVVTFFAFTQSWNEFLYANVFVNSVEVRTITTGLSLFVVEDVFFWGPMMGASFLSTLPPLIMYLIFQRWVVKGLTLGAVKG